MKQTKTISVLARVLGVLVVLSMVVAALPQPAQAAPLTASCATTYTVKQGDTLKKIADYYEVSRQRLAKVNDLEDDEDLKKGQELCIPSEATLPDDDDEKTDKKTTAKGTWTVFASGNRLIIDTKDFSRKETFFVKVSEYAGRGRAYTKVGTLRALKSDPSRMTFEIPDKLKGATSLSVCLKNLRTDALQCKTVSRR